MEFADLEAPLIWHLGFNGTEENQVVRFYKQFFRILLKFLEFSRHELSESKLPLTLLINLQWFGSSQVLHINEGSLRF